MTIEQIAKIIENEDYEVYGIRADNDIIYTVGDTCHNSHEWFQDYQEGTDFEYNEDMGCWDGGELPGTCALKVDINNIAATLEESRRHYGKHITLIAGYSYKVGNDMGEVIIEDAIVLAA